MRLLTLGLAGLCSALAVSPVLAQATCLSQNRFIRTTGGTGAVTNFTVSAPDFGVFDESRMDSYPNPDLYAPNEASASQFSSLLSNELRMNSNVSGADNYGSGGAGTGLGTSSLDVTFRIDDATDYIFSGNSSVFGSQASDFLIRLSGPSGVIFERRWFTHGPGPFAINGVFAPGVYRLETFWIAGASGFGIGSDSGQSELLLQFAPPGCPGDADGDGMVGLSDVASIVNCFGQAAGCNPDADLDDSGSINLADLAQVINAWGAVCP